MYCKTGIYFQCFNFDDWQIHDNKFSLELQNYDNKLSLELQNYLSQWIKEVSPLTISLYYY
jgi:hypothetical protein